MLCINEVLGTTRRPFCDDEIRLRDERHPQAVKVDFDSSFPRCLKFKAGNPHQHVHTHGWNAHLVEVPLFGKVCFSQPGKGRAELSPGFVDSRCIADVGTDPQIEVFGLAGFGVLDDGVAADNQIPNAVGVETVQ